MDALDLGSLDALLGRMPLLELAALQCVSRTLRDAIQSNDRLWDSLLWREHQLAARGALPAMQARRSCVQLH